MEGAINCAADRYTPPAGEGRRGSNVPFFVPANRSGDYDWLFKHGSDAADLPTCGGASKLEMASFLGAFPAAADAANVSLVGPPGGVRYLQDVFKEGDDSVLALFGNGLHPAVCGGAAGEARAHAAD